MVTNRSQHSGKKPVKKGLGSTYREPNRIGASTPFDFSGKNLTPYGGLLPVATMLEKLGFQTLMEETVTVKRLTKVMSGYQFLLAMVLGLYIGFSRLNQLRFIARDPILTGVLKIEQLPPQCMLWRFLAALHGSVAQQILRVQGVTSNFDAQIPEPGTIALLSLGFGAMLCFARGRSPHVLGELGRRTYSTRSGIGLSL